MKIIAAHKNTDFDALASLIAAKKLHPNAEILLPTNVQPAIKQYLALYRNQFPYIEEQQLTNENIDEVILVDTSHPSHTGNVLEDVQVHTMTIYDHHPESLSLPEGAHGETAEVGATITILIEHLKEKEIELCDWERTLFALGIYTDTGSLTYGHTTSRDLYALLYLFEQGISLDVVQEFYQLSFSNEQKDLFMHLLQEGKPCEMDGLTIMIGTIASDTFIGRLNDIVEQWLDFSNADACISIAKMKKTVFVTARSRNDRIDVSRVLSVIGGGGHQQAAAATIKNGDPKEIENEIHSHLSLAVKPALLAKQMMSYPVKSVHPSTSIDEVKNKILRYGHSGFPVVEESKLVGMISRRDVDKAAHHGLGHAPVKGHMTEKVITCDADSTSETVQQLMMDHDIGRLPVLTSDDELMGMISRSDLLQLLHDKQYERKQKEKRNLIDTMVELLPADKNRLLQTIGHIADEMNVNAFLIGGVVRDLWLHRKNEDIDITIEGDGIAFARAAAKTLGGSLYTHDSFLTAKIVLSSGQHIDIATARAEYYDAPSSLPKVVRSNLREDLYRRDFTINAMAIHLNEASFGTLVDPFGGEKDLTNGKIRVLHNLSFIEDPTRILRALRFEQKFGYILSEDTLRFAKKAEPAIIRLSTDRIKAECTRLFEEVTAVATFQRMYELELLSAFIPFASWSLSSKRMLENLENRASMGNIPDVALFIPLFAFQGQLQHLSRFALTKSENQLLNSFSRLKILNEPTLSSLGSLHENIHDIENTPLLIFEKYVEISKNQDFALLIKEYRKKRHHIPSLLTGDDLRALNLTPGPQYKHYLLRSECLWIEGKISNREEALQWLHSRVK
ncbi:tRNA nucleotidyltransferase (CCA-adding enzyme) [Geomicrobium halophilum]|uniref:tRNA nucleotidyltransferase (CCA-adding enzyme) n=1 Tax=Geomicrobium halophilum TaxID=549000 RepID=A0A841PML6_9BACL|nr:CBS domain-containing protein [Geomicrobium halophilum]MBB6448466.1 tRNA nucleotidyltransferase (CCA-adding enzyme) [Geomicrobium halophilum]